MNTYCNCYFFFPGERGGGGGGRGSGAVMRALASHLCAPGSIPVRCHSLHFHILGVTIRGYMYWDIVIVWKKNVM